MDPERPSPDIVAAHDQLQAEVQQKGRVVAAYWLQLRADGVDDYEAMKLTLAFQRRLLFPDAVADFSDDDADC